MNNNYQAIKPACITVYVNDLSDIIITILPRGNFLKYNT